MLLSEVLGAGLQVRRTETYRVVLDLESRIRYFWNCLLVDTQLVRSESDKFKFGLSHNVLRLRIHHWYKFSVLWLSWCLLNLCFLTCYDWWSLLLMKRRGLNSQDHCIYLLLLLHRHVLIRDIIWRLRSCGTCSIELLLLILSLGLRCLVSYHPDLWRHALDFLREDELGVKHDLVNCSHILALSGRRSLVKPTTHPSLLFTPLELLCSLISFSVWAELVGDG
jgi:hypothetical protein